MAEARRPGEFILEFANRGQEVTTLLLRQFSSTQARDMAAHISIALATLTEAGHIVNKNSEYFKDNFQSTFHGILTKTAEKYDIICAACDKVATWKRSESKDDALKPPKGLFDRLIWAFGMTRKQFNEFSRSLDECYKPALILNYLVNLIVLQITGYQRKLTPAEQTLLYQSKTSIPELLEGLRDLEVRGVVMFSLAEPVKPVNVSQIAEAAKLASDIEPRNDDASGTTIAVTDSVTPKGRADSGDTNGKGQESSDGKTNITQIEPEKKEITFEMYEMVNRTTTSRQFWKSWSLLGISVKRISNETSAAWQIERIPISQEDLDSFLQKEKANEPNYEASKADSLIHPPINCSGALYSLINKKNDIPRHHHRPKTWFLECLVPIKEENKSRWFRKEKTVQHRGYTVVIRGEVCSRQHPLGGPPGPLRPGFRWNSPPVITVVGADPRRSDAHKLKLEKKVTKIKLTQSESEVVINDFLASFSTLYDGIPVERRGIAFREIDMDNVYESDDTDSTDSSSCLLADD